MPAREPWWWYPGREAARGAPWPAIALSPVARIWGAVASWRLAHVRPYVSALPVVCIGNFTAGGTGKTPLALSLAGALREQGWTPVFLTRGYGAAKGPPRWVEPARDTVQDVGDEALLLARAAPVMVTRDRAAGAREIERSAIKGSRTVILMDDGLQNPGLAKSFSIAVVDGARGLGNGRVIPSGPLRAPLAVQLPLVDAFVINGGQHMRVDEPDDPRLKAFTGPRFRAAVSPAEDIGWLTGQRVLAYSGIGNPGRFFALLERAGATIAERREFPDHHVFSEADAAALLDAARARDAILVTTEKDVVRLAGNGGQRGVLREASRTIPVRLQFADDGLAALVSLVAGRIGRGAYRSQ